MNAQSSHPTILWPSFWNVQSPERIPNHLTAVAYADGKWLAAGDSGSMLSSVDGTNWNVEAAAVYNGIRGLHHGDGQWIAVGDEVIIRSLQWQNWRGVDPPAARQFRSVQWADGLWVAVGEDHLLAISEDGVQWTRITSESIPSDLRDVHYHGGLWMAVGAEGAITTSSDGLIWEAQEIRSLVDPLNESRDVVLTAAAFGNDRWFVVGAKGDPGEEGTGIMVRSQDAINWEAVDLGSETPAIYDLVFDDDQGVAVGASGLLLHGTADTEWTALQSPTPRELYAAAKGPEAWVAVGEKGVVVGSSDGRTWRILSDPARPDLHDLQFGGGQWLAIGQDGYALKSDDGERWQSFVLPENRSMNRAHYDNGNWVAVGNRGALMTSLNGLESWMIRQTPTESNLHDVDGGDGHWLAAGDNFTLMESTNLEQWKILDLEVNSDSAKGANLKGLAFAEGYWFAVGSKGLIMRSTDRTRWEILRQTVGRAIYDIAHHGDKWMAVGSDEREWGSPFYLISYDNGLSWIEIASSSPYQDEMRVVYGESDWWGIVKTSAPAGFGEFNPGTVEPSSVNLFKHILQPNHSQAGASLSTGFCGRLFGIAVAEGRWKAVGEDGVVLDYNPDFEEGGPRVERQEGPFVKISIPFPGAFAPPGPFPRVWDVTEDMNQPFETVINWPMIEWPRLTYRWRVNGKQFYMRLRKE